jgi:hypothetical protein
MFYPSIIKDPIQRLNRIPPIRIKLPYKSIRLLIKTNTTSNLEKLQPLVHALHETSKCSSIITDEHAFITDEDKLSSSVNRRRNRRI